MRTNRVPNTSRMQSFILFVQLLVEFFNWDKTDIHQLLRQFIYSLHSSVYAYSDHVLFMNSDVGNFEKTKQPCMCVYLGFSIAYSHVQQKVVMRRWVEGQTRGPVEAKRRTRGRRPQKWVIRMCCVCLDGQLTVSFRFCLSWICRSIQLCFPPTHTERGKMIKWSSDKALQTKTVWTVASVRMILWGSVVVVVFFLFSGACSDSIWC